MKTIFYCTVCLQLMCQSSQAQRIFTAPSDDVTTRWISPENPNGEKGKGGLVNRRAKGNAFYIVPPGETKTIMEVSSKI